MIRNKRICGQKNLILRNKRRRHCRKRKIISVHDTKLENNKKENKRETYFIYTIENKKKVHQYK